MQSMLFASGGECYPLMEQMMDPFRIAADFYATHVPRPILRVGENDTIPFDSYSPVAFASIFRVSSLDELVRLATVLHLPEVISNNGYKASRIEGLAVCLARLACPGRLIELLATLKLNWSRGKLSSVFRGTVHILATQWSQYLEYDKRLFSDRERLAELSEANNAAGFPFANTFAFIDCTVLAITRPSGAHEDQRGFYTGHQRTHVVRFQAITSPDGMIIGFWGPVEGELAGAEPSRVFALCPRSPLVTSFTPVLCTFPHFTKTTSPPYSHQVPPTTSRC